MGIELKGWYVLAKEKEPSFRYKVTPAVCAPADLLVVVPWAYRYIDIEGDGIADGRRFEADLQLDGWYVGGGFSFGATTRSTVTRSPNLALLR